MINELFLYRKNVQFEWKIDYFFVNVGNILHAENFRLSYFIILGFT
jgi:hypothetical protein